MKSKALDLAVVTLLLFLPAFIYVLYYYYMDKSAVGGFEYGFSKFVIFSFPYVYVRWIRKEGLPLIRWNAAAARIGTIFGLVVSAAILAIYFLFIKGSALLLGAPEKIHSIIGGFGVTSVATFIVLGIFISFVNSAVEEYFWRWFVYGRLVKHFRFWIAAAISSVGFALNHYIFLINNLPEESAALSNLLALGIVIGGLLWCYLYKKTGSIMAPLVSHIIIDISLIIVGLDLLF